jgi:hypothetical protein
MSWFSKIARAAVDPLSLAGVGWTNVAEKAVKGFGGGGGGTSGVNANVPAMGQTESDVNYFREASRRRAAELRNLSGEAGGYDPTVAARYTQEAEAPIDQSYFQASQGMARKGAAGIPVGAQMAGQAALSGERMGAKSQARLKAIRAATQEKSDVYSAKRQALLDQLSAEGASLDPQMAYLRAQLSQKQIEAALAAQKEQKNAAMWGGLGQIGGAVVGGMFGGPPGAMAGGKLGGSLGDMWGGLDMNTAPDYFGTYGYM